MSFSTIAPGLVRNEPRRRLGPKERASHLRAKMHTWNPHTVLFQDGKAWAHYITGRFNIQEGLVKMREGLFNKLKRLFGIQEDLFSICLGLFSMGDGRLQSQKPWVIFTVRGYLSHWLRGPFLLAEPSQAHCSPERIRCQGHV